MDGWFNRPLEVWRPTSAGDGQGGETESTAKVAGDPLDGKVDQPTAKDQTVAAQNSARLDHVIYFDGTVDVRRGDELRDLNTAPRPARFHVFAVVQPSEPEYTKAFVSVEQFEES